MHKKETRQICLKRNFILNKLETKNLVILHIIYNISLTNSPLEAMKIGIAPPPCTMLMSPIVTVARGWDIMKN